MKNVIITGANGGIGRALIESFCENGSNVWACLRSKQESFETWLNECAKKNCVWIRPIYFDLLKPEDIKRGMQEIIADKQSVDVLINNAGVGHMRLFQMTTLDTIRNLYEVNLFSAMELCQLVLRVMLKQKKGHIINITSTAAEEVYVGNCIYGASKAALSSFTKSLAAEVVAYGIRVNAVAPGLTDTNMSHIFEGNNPSLPLSRSALGRKLTPKEIADVVVTLTREEMHAINGQVICVNGGAK